LGTGALLSHCFLSASRLHCMGSKMATGIGTMSIREIQSSGMLLAADVLLFFVTSIVAMYFWLETRARAHKLQRIRQDADSLLLRGLFLQLLSVSNMMRAVGLVLDSQLHKLLAKKPRHEVKAWHKWFDYLLSSLPTLVWCSMLSILLLYMVEIYYLSKWRHMPLLRPTFLFVNAVAYLLYGTIAGLTLQLSAPTYIVFRRFAYYLLGIFQAALSAGLVSYGLILAWQLRRRRRSTSLPTASSPQLVVRITTLAIIIPVTEICRTLNDFEYSVGNDISYLRWLAQIAAAKLLLQWLPSVAILFAFRPSACAPESVETPFGMDPFLSPSSEGLANQFHF